MSDEASYSVVLERSADEVWSVVRDFNSYPIWVNGIEDSYIEDGWSGSTVGGIRSFAVGGIWTRQRLVAHSDVDRFFSYEGCAPVEADLDGVARVMERYRGTLGLQPVDEGDRCFARWSSSYECRPEDAADWAAWWQEMLPAWLASLRDHLASLPSPH